MVQGCLNEPKVVLTFLNSCASFLWATVIREPNEWEWASIIMFGVMIWSGGVSRCALERGAESFVVRVCERVFFIGPFGVEAGLLFYCVFGRTQRGMPKGENLIWLSQKLPSVDWCQHHPKPLVCACDWWLFLLSHRPPRFFFFLKYIGLYRPTQ